MFSLRKRRGKRLQHPGVRAGTWVVASWVEGGSEYYAKQYVGDDNINGIQFSYPQSSSDAGSAVIEAYIDEFVPGDL